MQLYDFTQYLYAKSVLVLLPSTIDLLDWNSLIDDRTEISNLLMVPNLQVRFHLLEVKRIMTIPNNWYKKSIYFSILNLGKSFEYICSVSFNHLDREVRASVEKVYCGGGEADEEDVAASGCSGQGRYEEETTPRFTQALEG